MNVLVDSGNNISLVNVDDLEVIFGPIDFLVMTPEGSGVILATVNSIFDPTSNKEYRTNDPQEWGIIINNLRMENTLLKV